MSTKGTDDLKLKIGGVLSVYVHKMMTKYPGWDTYSKEDVDKYAVDKDEAVNEVLELVDQLVADEVRQALIDLRDSLPNPDDDTKFSSDGAGGWHTPTYQLAVADFISDIDAKLDELTPKQEKKL